jgi:hypothetical protein
MGVYFNADDGLLEPIDYASVVLTAKRAADESWFWMEIPFAPAKDQEDGPSALDTLKAIAEGDGDPQEIAQQTLDHLGIAWEKRYEPVLTGDSSTPDFGGGYE